LDSGQYRTSQYTARILNERGKERAVGDSQMILLLWLDMPQPD
jgi:hypothetical protein